MTGINNGLNSGMDDGLNNGHDRLYLLVPGVISGKGTNLADTILIGVGEWEGQLASGISS